MRTEAQISPANRWGRRRILARIVLTTAVRFDRLPGMPDPTWRVLDLGTVPAESACITYSCQGCGHEAQLPVVGTALAELNGGGVVFDGPHAMPRKIQCRRCRRVFENGG